MYTSTPDYVRTTDELTFALDKLAASDFLAIDTEFLRERTYYPKFCLLQIGTDDYCALFDVQALPSLAPILNFLNDRTRTKVLHAAHQDLEVLALANGQTRGATLAPIAGPFFDTQVAAAFLGMPGNIGYADLVQRRVQLSLDKGQSRTDWSRRPLSPEQLTYASADVIYLAELYHDLKAALAHSNRLEWLNEEAAQLEDPSRYATEPAAAWQRLRGLEQMQPEKRAAAKALAAWREQRAVSRDLPRGWIMSDDVLRNLADRFPTTREELAAIRDMPAATVEKRGDEILKLLADARANASSEPPASDFRPNSNQQKAVRKLMDFVREQATELGVSPEYMATRRDIEALVYSGSTSAFEKGWRAQSFGARLIALAAGER